MRRKRHRTAACIVMTSLTISSSVAFAPISQKLTPKSSRKRLLPTRNNDADEWADIDDDFASPLDKSSSILPTKREYQLPSTVETELDLEILSPSFPDKNNQPRESSLPGAEWMAHLLSAPLIEVSIAYLVILSSILVAIGTLSLGPSWQTTIENWQNVIGFAFVWEFAARWYSSDRGAFRYLSQPLVLVDLVVVIFPVVLPLLSGVPPWLTSQTGLINLRLLRILRLQRVLQDLETFSTFTAALGLGDVKQQVQPFQLQLARVILSLFTLLSVSAGLIYAAEHDVNPAMKNYFSALYFGLTTLTTVGFGDITPVTAQGKVVVSCSILAGVTVIPAQAAALVESLMEQDRATRNDEAVDAERQPSEATSNNRILPSSAVDAVTPCPSCGATFHWTSAKYCWSCGSRLE